MGVYTDPVFFYGLKFKYDKVKFLLTENEEFIFVAKEIDCYEFSNVWSELGYGLCSPYFDAPSDKYEYYIGFNLIRYSIEEIKNLDIEDMNNEIKTICKNLHLPYNKPGIIHSINIC